MACQLLVSIMSSPRPRGDANGAEESSSSTWSIDCTWRWIGASPRWRALCQLSTEALVRKSAQQERPVLHRCRKTV